MQREKRLNPTFSNIDLTIPVKPKELMANIQEDDCFSRLWQADNKLCAICADNEVCGILYHKRQSKKVKELEKQKGGFLDSIDFDAIDREQLLTWLKIKQRTTQEFIDKVTAQSKCPNPETVIYWVKSFIVETKGLSSKNGIIIFK